MVTESTPDYTSLVSGIGLLFLIGIAARIVSAFVPMISYLIVAILIGVVLANWVGVPDWAESGVATHKIWLESGIVMMGASVDIGRILTAGPLILILVGVTVLSNILLVEFLARTVFDIAQETGSLLAAGSSICGVSAVVAIAGSIDPDERNIAYAAGTILLFDAVTLLTYPVIGKVLGLSDVVFGMWAGLTMFSTGPVTAAAFAFSDSAGEWAVLIKLTRNALIGFTALGYAAFYARASGLSEEVAPSEKDSWYLWRTFPKFILGFIVVMLLANFGMLQTEQITSLENASNWAFMLAFAGLGLEIQINEFRSTGITPLLLVCTSFSIISLLELLILVNTF